MANTIENWLILKHAESNKIGEAIHAKENLLTYLNPDYGDDEPDFKLFYSNFFELTDLLNEYVKCRRYKIRFNSYRDFPKEACDAAAKNHGFDVTCYYSNAGWKVGGIYRPSEDHLVYDYDESQIPKELDYYFDISLRQSEFNEAIERDEELQKSDFLWCSEYAYLRRNGANDFESVVTWKVLDFDSEGCAQSCTMWTVYRDEERCLP